MSTIKPLPTGIAGFALLGIYSWIMTGTNGTAASWAWLVLIAAVGLLAMAARAAVVARRTADDR